MHPTLKVLLREPQSIDVRKVAGLLVFGIPERKVQNLFERTFVRAGLFDEYEETGKNLFEILAAHGKLSPILNLLLSQATSIVRREAPDVIKSTMNDDEKKEAARQFILASLKYAIDIALSTEEPNKADFGVLRCILSHYPEYIVAESALYNLFKNTFCRQYDKMMGEKYPIFLILQVGRLISLLMGAVFTDTKIQDHQKKYFLDLLVKSFLNNTLGEKNKGLSAIIEELTSTFPSQKEKIENYLSQGAIQDPKQNAPDTPQESIDSIIKEVEGKCHTLLKEPWAKNLAQYLGSAPLPLHVVMVLATKNHKYFVEDILPNNIPYDTFVQAYVQKSIAKLETRNTQQGFDALGLAARSDCPLWFEKILATLQKPNIELLYREPIKYNAEKILSLLLKEHPPNNEEEWYYLLKEAFKYPNTTIITQYTQTPDNLLKRSEMGIAHKAYIEEYTLLNLALKCCRSLLKKLCKGHLAEQAQTLSELDSTCKLLKQLMENNKIFFSDTKNALCTFNAIMQGIQQDIQKYNLSGLSMWLDTSKQLVGAYLSHVIETEHYDHFSQLLAKYQSDTALSGSTNITFDTSG